MAPMWKQPDWFGMSAGGFGWRASCRQSRRTAITPRAETAVWTELGSIPTELERYPFRGRQPYGWRAGRSAITLAPVAGI
jgi:hypothetical protein